MESIAREIPPEAVVGALTAGLVFIALMSLVAEPLKRQINVVIAGGFAALYLNGGFGLWEFVYAAVATVPAVLGHRSYRWIGVAWLMHTGWDLAHHYYGNTLWLWSETSSIGCAVMDAAVGVWFLAGAPSVWARLGRRAAAQRAV